MSAAEETARADAELRRRYLEKFAGPHVAMRYRVLRYARLDPKISDAAYRQLAVQADYGNARGEEIKPENGTTARLMGVSVRTVERRNAELAVAGYVQPVRQYNAPSVRHVRIPDGAMERIAREIFERSAAENETTPPVVSFGAESGTETTTVGGLPSSSRAQHADSAPERPTRPTHPVGDFLQADCAVTSSANSQTASRPPRGSRSGAGRPDPAVQVPPPDTLDAAAPAVCTEYDAACACANPPTVRDLARFFRMPENDRFGSLPSHLMNAENVGHLRALCDRYGRAAVTSTILDALRRDGWDAIQMPADLDDADDLPMPRARRIRTWGFFAPELERLLRAEMRRGAA